MKRIALSLPAICLWPTLAAAASPVAPAPGFGASLLQVLWGLLIVIGLMLVLYALARKRFSLPGVGGSGKIKVLEMRPLMAKTALALVEVEGEKLLIGIGNGTVRMLTHLPAGKDGQDTSLSESHCFADHLDREQQS